MSGEKFMTLTQKLKSLVDGFRQLKVNEFYGNFNNVWHIFILSHGEIQRFLAALRCQEY